MITEPVLGRRDEDGGVRLWATVGLGDPIQAAAPTPPNPPPPTGTVNVVA